MIELYKVSVILNLFQDLSDIVSWQDAEYVASDTLPCNSRLASETRGFVNSA